MRRSTTPPPRRRRAARRPAPPKPSRGHASALLQRPQAPRAHLPARQVRQLGRVGHRLDRSICRASTWSRPAKTIRNSALRLPLSRGLQPGVDEVVALDRSAFNVEDDDGTALAVVRYLSELCVVYPPRRRTLARRSGRPRSQCPAEPYRGLPPVKRSGTGEHLVRLDDLSFGLAIGHGGLIA
jgi:hypothetical protein